jgi:hypothetical protein
MYYRKGNRSDGSMVEPQHMEDSMSLRNVLRTAALTLALASGALLSGCASGGGIFNGLSSDVMSMIIIYRSDHKPLTYAQYQAVQGVAKEMGITLTGQLTSPFKAMATGGLAYAAAGAAGGSTQALFYPGALAGAAAGYSAAVYGMGGVVTGATTYSYGKDYDVADMTEKTMRDREDDGENVFHHIHVSAAFVESTNREDLPAESLRSQMPDFHGEPVGAPRR